MKKTKTYKISGMHCSSCAMLIEGELEDRGLMGVCSFAKGVVDVEVSGDEPVDEKVKEAVEAAGYSLQQ